MNVRWALDCLDLAPEASTRDIRRRYSELLKLNRPEDNPQGFQQLRAAYEICLEYARLRDAQAVEEAAAATVPGVVAAETVATPSALPAVHTGGSTAAAVPDDAATEAAGADAVPAPRTPPPAPVPARAPIAAAVAAPFPAADLTLPELRDPGAVVDELLQLDASNAAAVPGWFRQTAELVNFDTRDAVEAELLHRLVNGWRPSLVTLNLANAEFGWRDLALPRRLAAHGIVGESWQAVDTALQQAFAESQFSDWLERGAPLRGEKIGVPREKSTLRKLHAQRGRTPSLWRAFQAGQVAYVNELLKYYAHRYGGRALVHVFGVEVLEFWRRAHPGSEANWLQFRLLALRLAMYFSAIWVGVTSISIDWKARPPVLALGDALWPITLGLAIAMAVLLAYGGAKLGYAHFRQQWWPRFLLARHELLEQRFLPWLRPARALPLLVLVGGLLGMTQWLAGAGITGLLCGVLALAVFGWRGLATAFVAGVMIARVAGNWVAGDEWFALFCSTALGLAWLGDWLERRRFRRG